MLDTIKKIFSNRILVGVLVIIIAVGGYFGYTSIKGNQSQTQYQTAKVEKGTIVASVSTSGQILSANVMNLNTQASGTIKTIYVKDGQQVTAGQKILDIQLDQQGQQNNAQAWSSYLSAKNSLTSAQDTLYSLQSSMFTAWQTYMDLAQSSLYQNSDGTPKTDQRTLPDFHIAQDNWLAAEAKYNAQQAVITQSQAALNNTWNSYQLTSPTVTAPISGTVSSFVVVEGMTIGGSSTTTTAGTYTNQKICVIENQTNPLATFSLSDIDVSKVSIGQRATLTLDSLPDKTFTGKVVSVDRIGTVSNSVVNYQVLIQLDTTNPQILPNMTADANIITATKDNVLLVPLQAVITQSGQTVVRILQNGQVETVPVQTGLSSDTQTEIVSGLNEGQDVITSTVTSGQQSSGGSIFSGTRGFGGGGATRAIIGR
jgi:RND family efflux transporter MFP subunit